MARKVIKIDTYIGSWGYNKNLLRFDLQDTEKDGAIIEISSLGEVFSKPSICTTNLSATETLKLS